MLKYFRNRKTIGYLVGSGLLVLVIIAFIILYIPDFMGPAGGASLANEVANVEGISITAQQFLQRYRAQERVYRAQLGNQFNPALLKQLGLDEMVLQGLIQEALIAVEAEHQGLVVSDRELGDQILKDPSFQAAGRFIGRDAYLRLLQQSGWTPQRYEDLTRQTLLREKLRAVLLDGIIASSEEIEAEFRRRNEKAKLDYIFIPRAELEGEVTVSDQDLAGYYEAHKDKYRLPVQRKLRYLALTPQSFQAAVRVTDREIERYYNRNIYLYETPERVEASHILFKTAGKDEQQVRKKAEEVLAQIRAGADFADMARKYSEDPSADKGGSLGVFGHGELVPEFEQAAFSMEVGQISDLVRTTYGFHIIKVTGKQEPVTRPLAEVRDEIKNTLTMEKAQQKLEEAITSATRFLRDMESLEALAQRYQGVQLQETGFFGKLDPPPQLGNSADARRLAFELEMGKVSPPIRVATGYLFFEVLSENPPRIPPLEEIKEQVKSDVIREKANRLAFGKAEKLKARLDSGKPAGVVAKEAGRELKSMESFLRGSELPEAGKSPAVQDVAFSMEPGSFSEPLLSDNGYVLLQVMERTGFSPERYAAEKDEFTEQILNEKRQRAWSAYLQELQRRYTVRIDREALRRVTG